MWGAILILLGPCVTHALDHMTLLIDIRVFLQVDSRLEVGVRARLAVIALDPRNVHTRFSCACVCVKGRGWGCVWGLAETSASKLNQAPANKTLCKPSPSSPLAVSLPPNLSNTVTLTNTRLHTHMLTLFPALLLTAST